MARSVKFQARWRCVVLTAIMVFAPMPIWGQAPIQIRADDENSWFPFPTIEGDTAAAAPRIEIMRMSEPSRRSYLRFPISVERAMMGEALQRQQPKNVMPLAPLKVEKHFRLDPAPLFRIDKLKKVER